MNNRDIIFRSVGGGGLKGSLFHTIVSVSNLLSAWNEFKRGKRSKVDVADFELNLEENIFRLHEDLVSKTYVHDPYVDFYICDPKRRHIHKASVRDRVFHQAIFRVLNPIFDKHFIYDSYSSRLGKGTHKGVLRLRRACRKVSQNWKVKTYVLKCDVRKFFDSIDHSVLQQLIAEKISDPDTLSIIRTILNSFEKEKEKGLPLGNVTSQLFANVYLNELDQFAKHALKAHYYFRYCDDFVIVHHDLKFLEEAVLQIKSFLSQALLLDLHLHKVKICTIRQGVDFLGYVVLPRAIVIRTSTKKRMRRKITYAHEQFLQGIIDKEKFQAITESYFGALSHCRSGKLRAWLRKLASMKK